MEEDLKENQNEQQEETATENEEVDGANEESELSDDSSTEEKEPEPKEEITEKEVEENEEKESDEKEESAEEEIKEEPSANEEKVVKTAKSSKSEKKQGSDSPKSSDKKTSVATATPKIKSDIVVQELDLKTIVSFNKEYFEVKITDTLDLTTTEIDFYDGQNGFNGDTTYAQNNIDFFALDCKSDCWGNIHVRTNAVQIEQFRR